MERARGGLGWGWGSVGWGGVGQRLAPFMAHGRQAACIQREFPLGMALVPR